LSMFTQQAASSVAYETGGPPDADPKAF
jgi:hypothetical protein